MRKRYSPPALLALGLSLVVSACDDTLSPEEAFDPDQTTADLAVIDSTFNTAAFQSLAALGAVFDVPGAAPIAAANDLVETAARPDEPDFAVKVIRATRRLMAVRAADAAVELIPEQLRGLTLVYSTQEQHYIVDESRTDAPATGIRFILYSVNPVTHEIAEPLTEIGYADLIDESTDTAGIVRLVVVSEGVTFVNYTVSASGTLTAPTVSIAGFLSDGTNQVDFTLVHSFELNAGAFTISIDYDIDVAAADFHVEVAVTISGTEQQNTTTATVTVTSGSNTVTVQADLTNDTGTLDVSVNNVPFATVTVTNTGFEATDPSGNPLSQSHANALRQIFEFVEEVFDIFEDLFDPVEFLFNLETP
ncbi:MAG: hypothetical protein ACE5PT_09060 [Gemmatimonadales bacterium]